MLKCSEIFNTGPVPVGSGFYFLYLTLSEEMQKVFGLSRTYLQWHGFVQCLGKTVDLESGSQNSGGFLVEGYETVRKKIKTEENNMGE